MLALFSVTLWFMSTPLGETYITGPLEEMYSNRLPPDGSPIVILVLSGGSSYNNNGKAVQPGIYTLERLYCAVSLAKKRGGMLIFSGGNVYGLNQKSEAEIMADCAKNMGWNGKIILEKKSRTTKENLDFTAKLLEAETIHNLVIVTNAFHMPRSVYSASKAFPNVNIYPYASGRTTDPVFKGLPYLLPDAGCFRTSCFGIKEWIGLTVYRIY